MRGILFLTLLIIGNLTSAQEIGVSNATSAGSSSVLEIKNLLGDWCLKVVMKQF